MTVSIVGSFGSTTEVNGTAGNLGTLPAGISNGDRAVCLIHSGLLGNTLPSPPAGWTLVDSCLTTTASSTWLLTKTLSSSDSSTNPAFTIGTTSRFGSVGIVLTGASLDTVSAVASVTTAGTNLLTPTITPVADDCLQVMLAGTSFSSAIAWSALTPAAGWTEDKDLGSSAGSGVSVGTYAAHKQLTGQGGVLQSAATFTTTTNQRDNVWTLTYATATSVPGVRGDALQHSMNRLAGTTGLASQGAANIWAGTTGLSLVGALNVKAGNALPNYRELQGVLNQLAGTTGLGVDGAAAAIA